MQNWKELFLLDCFIHLPAQSDILKILQNNLPHPLHHEERGRDGHAKGPAKDLFGEEMDSQLIVSKIDYHQPSGLAHSPGDL